MSMWVLVASSSEARLFSATQRGKNLECLKTFSHPESREKGTDLVTDRPGHYQSRGTGHGAFGETHDAKEHEAEHFAHELAQELEKGRTENAYDELVLVAAPHFHGLLNTQLNDQTRNLIVSSINKDYTTVNERDLPEKIHEHLQ